jgi:chemotaxis protein methyltransferase CheR
VIHATTLTDEQTGRFAEICRARWGLQFGPRDAAALAVRVERAFQASAVSSLDAFAKILSTAEDSSPEIQAFVSQIAIGETSFFRYEPQFAALAATVLPEIVARRGARRLRIWSVGCSTGEEPYSIAMTIDRVLQDWRAWDIEILATDVNAFALRRARDAVYSDWSFRGVGPEVRSRYFETRGRAHRLAHECKALVRFRWLNLADVRLPDPDTGLSDFDVIFCRNVLLYLDADLARGLARGFAQSLAPGGYLFVGHTEPDSAMFSSLASEEHPETILYRTPLAGTVPPSDVAAHGPGPDSRLAEASAVPTSSAPLGADAALEAYADGDLDSAFEIAHEAIERGGDGPVLPHVLAQVAADRQDFDEVLYWSYVALHRDPFHVPTLLLMGIAALEQGRVAQACDAIRKAIFLDATCPEAHYYLSLALRAEGEDERADASRQRASRLCAQSTREAPMLPIQQVRRVLCAT